MSNIDIFTVLYFAEAFFIGGGLFLWGYHTGIKHAMKDMKNIRKEKKEEKDESIHKRSYFGL